MTKIIKTTDGLGYAIQEGETITPITKIVDDGKTLKLPTNLSNRQYFSIKNFEDKNVNGELELTYKSSITITRNTGTTPRIIKPLEDWLSPEKKAIYLELRAEARKIRDDANTTPPLTELEKKQRAFEKAKLAYDELLRKEQGTPAPETIAEIKESTNKKGKKTSN